MTHVDLPDHLLRLGHAVHDLIDQYDAMDRWRQQVRDWVRRVSEEEKEPSSHGVALANLPVTLRIDQEYALLAAIHDNCVSRERNEELIDPWAEAADFGGPDKLVSVEPKTLEMIARYVTTYYFLTKDVRNRLFERSKADRLLKILRHVANDVRNAARLWTPDRSICADESISDPVVEYATFLQRADTETPSGGPTTQSEPVEEQEATVTERGKERLAKQTPVPPKHPWGDDDPKTPFSPKALADRLGIPSDDEKQRDNLRKRLEEWRKRNFDGGWIEVENRKPRDPQFLYPIGKAWPLIEDMKRVD